MQPNVKMGPLNYTRIQMIHRKVVVLACMHDWQFFHKSSMFSLKPNSNGILSTQFKFQRYVYNYMNQFTASMADTSKMKTYLYLILGYFRNYKRTGQLCGITSILCPQAFPISWIAPFPAVQQKAIVGMFRKLTKSNWRLLHACQYL